MTAKVCDIMAAMERLAPPDTCVSGDNCGLMVGHPEDAVSRVLLCMEADPFTVSEAIENGCDMILAHHPIFFDPIRSLRSDTPVGQTVRLLIENNIALYCAHTNFDRCAIGTSRALAAVCGVEETETDLFLAFGEAKWASVSELAAHLRKRLHSDAVCAFGEKEIVRVCVCAGSGNGELDGVLKTGAEVFVCGELKYHQMMEYLARGVAVITCGHRESEQIALDGLCRHLQNDENLLQYHLRYRIACASYGMGPKAVQSR